MRNVVQLRCLLGTITPSELDGILELKAALAGLYVDKTRAQLEREHDEIADSTLALGDKLLELRASFLVLLARNQAVSEARAAAARAVAQTSARMAS